MQAFFKEIDLFRSSVRNVMIAGGGKISFYLARRLLAQGMRVKIIEQSQERCRELCEHLLEADVICGDASSQNLLQEEGLEGVDAFVALTGMDEINAILSLYARTQRVTKVVTKVTQLPFTDMLENIGIETIVSPKEVTLEFLVEKKTEFTGIPLKDLSLKQGFLIAYIVRDRKLIVPAGHDTIEEHDIVLLVTTHPHIQSLHEMLA